MTWLVTVKKPGIKPSRLHVNSNMKSENTKGKNLIPSFPAVSIMVLATNS